MEIIDKTIEDVSYREFVQREEHFTRAAYNPEVEFYTYVVAGDTKKVMELTSENFLAKKDGWGTLSTNTLQNIKYHFVITTSVIARYCINAGLDLQTAYNLSDHYIFLADKCNSIDKIASLHPKMCMDYTNLMKKLHNKRAVSPYIIKCLDYIYDNLHTRITLVQLCDITGMSISYLSRSFKAEIGVSISDYICNKKIETSQNMLKFSNYSIADIAAILAFPSQSYYAKIFKEKTGMTPFAYRKTQSI